MNYRRIVFLATFALLAVVPFAVRNADSQTAEPSATRWQHMAVRNNIEEGLSDAEFSRQIVRLGNEGWELVDVETIVKDGTTGEIVYFFKRPQ